MDWFFSRGSRGSRGSRCPRGSIGWSLAISLVACSGDEGDGSDGGDDGSGGSAATASDGGSMTSPPDDATSVADASADGTGSDAGPGTSDGSDGGSGSEASATAGDTGEAIGCGDAGCGPDMVCVHPCCGGAPPVCEPAPASGECPDGTIPVDPSQCAFGCDGQTCCQPSGPCEAPDPYCVPAGNLICGGDPQVADQCSVDDCFGTLRGDDLACTCA